MAKLRIEDIIFWILVLTVIAVAIWLAFGSPDFQSSLLMIIIFVAGSEILLWRALFSLDRKTAVGFERVKSDLDKVDNKLGNIESLIKRIETRLIGRKR